MIDWLRDTGPHGTGHFGKVGKWMCFSTYWKSFTKDYQGPHYALRCSLPGLKEEIGVFETEEEAFRRAEQALAHWIKAAGLSTPAVRVEPE